MLEAPDPGLKLQDIAEVINANRSVVAEAGRDEDYRRLIEGHDERRR